MTMILQADRVVYKQSIRMLALFFSINEKNIDQNPQ